MRSNILFIITFVSVLVGQPSFTENIISTSADGAYSIHAVDVDSDGDMDVLSASFNDDKISWYENDGSENFTARTIATDVDGAHSVYAVDMDNDGDMDVLSASVYDDAIRWFINDGSENFTDNTLTGSVNDPKDLYPTDIDNDGDMDILVAEYPGVVILENNGTSGWDLITVEDNRPYTTSVHLGDFNGDENNDIVFACDNGIKWVVGPSYSGGGWITNSSTRDIFPIDMDNDGDIDVLAADFYGDQIKWYQNDGSGNFSGNMVAAGADGAISVHAGDIDNDGDIDAVSASEYDDKIVWYENDGEENFTSHIVSSDADGAYSVYLVDVDNDGYKDIVSASSEDDKIAWYRNVPPYSGPTWHVSTSGSDDNDGSDDSPFTTIQAGIDASSNGDTVWVAAGTYV